MHRGKEFRQYYRDQREFFHSMVREFARDNEEAAHLLRDQYDPDVERLLEGVSFLNAQTLHALDAELPELLHPLLQHMWPHALRPTPAVTVVQFDIKNADGMQLGATVPRGTVLHTGDVPVGDDGETCRFSFQTTYPLQILPLELREVELNAARSQIRLQLRTLRRASLQRLLAPQGGILPKLRLSLHGDVRHRYALYWALRRARQLTLRVPREDIELSSSRHPEIRLRGLGFAKDEALLPYTPHGQPLGPPGGGADAASALPYAHRHLYEYMSFPEKFLFFDLEGLELLEKSVRQRGLRPDRADTFEVLIELAPDDRMNPHRLGQDELRVFCVPAVNLARHTARTELVDHTRLEYELRLDGDPGHYDVFLVERVLATHQRGIFRDVPLRCFDGFARAASRADGLPLYQVRPRATLAEKTTEYPAPRTFLAMVSPTGEPAELLADYGLQIEAEIWVTNRDLPTKHLRADALRSVSSTLPEGVRLRNLNLVSDAAPAPLRADGMWRFLGMLSQGFGLITSAESLRDLIALHDPVALYSGRARRRRDALCGGIERIVEMQSRPILHGRPRSLIMGTLLTLQLRDSAFEQPGQFLLFGEVLSHFLAEMASINTYFQLNLKTHSLGALHFAPMIGGQGLMSSPAAIKDLP